jgi:outer membrane protein OmpA-like peptidoglycan-associated protein
MTSPEGDKYYTEETDAKGYAEVLVPVGKTYELEYLSLGRKTISAKVPVPDSPNQNIKLTLRYKRFDTEGKTMVVQGPPPPNVFVLEGVNFDTGKAKIRSDSLSRLDRVVEYMTHKKGVRIEISGHTDNVGKAEANKDLSRRRAESCKQYLVDKGIDAGRIETVGYGSERPIDTNDTPEGRQRNRRIEAKEL